MVASYSSALTGLDLIIPPSSHGQKLQPHFELPTLPKASVPHHFGLHIFWDECAEVSSQSRWKNMFSSPAAGKHHQLVSHYKSQGKSHDLSMPLI